MEYCPHPRSELKQVIVGAPVMACMECRATVDVDGRILHRTASKVGSRWREFIRRLSVPLPRRIPA